MRGRAYIKDIRRTFIKSFSRFISVFFMAMLGAGVYAGLGAVSPNMKNSVSAYYGQQNFMDLRILSPAGPFTRADADAVAALDCVESVMASVSTEAICAAADKDYVARVQTFPDEADAGDKNYLNRLELVEGRMPQGSNECVVITGSLIPNKIHPGDSVLVKEPRLNKALFAETAFTVVGFVKTPQYMSYMLGAAGIGSGQVDCVVFVRASVFPAPLYTELFVRVKGAGSANQFSKAYKNTVAAALEEIRTAFPAYVVLDRDALESHVEFTDAANNMKSVATVFPLIFFLVAALVSLTTMTRMIDEERLSIGAYRSLGYGSVKIALKYILYAFLATIAGALIGIGIGFELFTRVIWGAYGIVFNFPALSVGFYPGILTLTAALMLFFTLSATVYACARTLRERPALLLQPKSPQVGRRVFLERIKPFWRRLPFSYKITARNTFLNKKRFFMTVIGVAGCMALLLIGFGLKDSINAVLMNQFEQVFRYDATAAVGGTVTGGLQATLDDASRITDYAFVLKKALNVENEKGEPYDAFLVAPKTDGALRDFIVLQERKSKKPIAFGSNSVVVTEKLARELSLRVGSEIRVNFLEDAAAAYPLTVTGVTENYVLEYVYVGSSAYVAAFGAAPEYNQVLLKMNGASEEQRRALSEKLFASGAVPSVAFNADTVKRFSNSFKSLDSIVYVLIVSAALLAVVVLYNLTNINIVERKREIATLKVLGFYARETNMYVFRETLILTLLGIIAGIFLGLGLFGFVVTTIELKVVLIAHIIKPLSYVFSFGLTAVFSVLVALLISGKIKGIDMVESLKSVE